MSAFPAYHAVWVLLAARLHAGWLSRLAPLAWVIAALIVASCLTTGMHALIDMIAAIAVFILIVRAPVLWESGSAAAPSGWPTAGGKS